MTTTIQPNLAFIGNFGGGEIILIFLIVLLCSVPRRFPNPFRSLGKGVNEFRKAKNEWEQDIQDVMSQEPLEDHDFKDKSKSIVNPFLLKKKTISQPELDFRLHRFANLYWQVQFLKIQAIGCIRTYLSSCKYRPKSQLSSIRGLLLAGLPVVPFHPPTRFLPYPNLPSYA